MGTNQKNDILSWITDSDFVPHGEGQLAVDVVENQKQIIIRTAIAGVKPADLDISVTADTVTIKGKREIDCQEEKSTTVHIHECHWGSFSRSIVLPAHVKSDKADAKLKNGILTITLPKTGQASSINVQEIT
ncbi:MAG: Hsp20/alpha crystallin family protein [Candidatus Uhrbacteria bacterium]